MKKSKYFKITELVCKHTHDRFKEAAWMFIDDKLIDTLDILKEKIFPNKRIIINNWNAGASYSQRGLRCNVCDLVKSKKTNYLSAHQLGKGVDMTIEGVSASEARKTIEKNQVLLPYPIRLESDKLAPTWVHLDVYNMGNGKKVTCF